MDAGNDRTPLSLPLLQFLLFFVLLVSLASPGFSAISISPSSASLVVSNRSFEFSIEIIPEPGQENKRVDLTAVYPQEEELSWKYKSLIVGQRARTSIRLTPRTPGDFVLTIRLSGGSGVLPLEEYVRVKVADLADYSALGKEISEYESKTESLIGRASSLPREKNEQLYQRLDSLSSDLSLARQSYEGARYSEASQFLSKAKVEYDALEEDVSTARAEGSILGRAFPFLPSFALNLSLDLAILIAILIIAIAISARTFLLSK